jgi:ribulose-phosphate 3-epimerase
MDIKIGASILSADLSELSAVIENLEKAGADFIKSFRKKTELPFEAHLMIEKPENYVRGFVDAGCDIITLHVESSDRIKSVIRYVKSVGKKVGLALKPKTSLDAVLKYTGNIDIVLVMTVEPGFARQKFIDMSDKIMGLKKIIADMSLNLDIAVDGGINKDTAKAVKMAGANILVSASYILDNNYKNAIDNLRMA